MKKFITAILLSTLSTFSYAGLFDFKAKTTVSDFDGKVSVDMQPTWTTCKGFTVCPLIGYSWLKNDPSNFMLIVEINDSLAKKYYSIDTLKFNIDGDIIELKAFGDGRTRFSNSSISTVSRNYFIAPMELTERILNAKSVKVRVTGNDSLFDSTLVGEGKETGALKYLKVFLEEVKKNI